VGGAKMSSSRGLGASARDMADLLPPEVLRFLMIRTKPNSPVNFDVNEDGIVKLFNEFDRYHTRVTRDKNATPDEALVYQLAETRSKGDYFLPNFQLLSTLAQMPHLDPMLEIQKRHGAPLTEIECHAMERRLKSAAFWVEHYAKEEEKTRLQESLPASHVTLSATQCAFLQRLGVTLANVVWEDEQLQAAVFETARLTPIEQPLAFKAIYRVLLDKDAGPKAGNLFAYLERALLQKRFSEVPLDKAVFWKETALTQEQLVEWMVLQKPKIASYEHAIQSAECGHVLELTVTMLDGKKHMRRVWLPESAESNSVLSALA